MFMASEILETASYSGVVVVWESVEREMRVMRTEKRRERGLWEKETGKANGFGERAKQKRAATSDQRQSSN
ncbi:hypothetical protein TIFTF001_027900 [Ficus carica]|uniref:Uncharacterized protein n=1 Tax=Ficus carica TaxID=3494 RepID=A0AA88DNT5_FICCA|nr:hypothetical protein TIFTF001_027900 [Ficus carica]